MLLAQLNRSADQFGRKTRYSIRDTGEADEKANLVVILDREILSDDTTLVYDFSETEQATVEIAAGKLSPELKVRIDKNTFGPTGDVAMYMDPSRFWIMDQTGVSQRRKELGWDERMDDMEAL